MTAARCGPIEERDSGAFVGEIGFADFKRDIVPAMQNVPELGFALVSAKHGKGYAREAVHAVLGWSDRHLPSARTVALSNEENAASLRVLQTSGYRIFDRAAFNGTPVLFFERYCARQSAAVETTV
ncbi:MAG TPA: GNAT family N-acetyltransferase [Candidatus Aquilonibacter sp.]